MGLPSLRSLRCRTLHTSHWKDDERFQRRPSLSWKTYFYQADARQTNYVAPFVPRQSQWSSRLLELSCQTFADALLNSQLPAFVQEERTLLEQVEGETQSRLSDVANMPSDLSRLITDYAVPGSGFVRCNLHFYVPESREEFESSRSSSEHVIVYELGWCFDRVAAKMQGQLWQHWRQLPLSSRLFLISKLDMFHPEFRDEMGEIIPQSTMLNNRVLEVTMCIKVKL